jgi:hypothetical protein
VQRGEECRGPRKITLGLVDIRLCGECIQVVRGDVENLIKLSQRFGKTTKIDIGKRVLGEQLNVARVEPLGFVDVTLTLVPLTSPPRDISKLLRNPAAIGHQLTCLLKVMHRGVVIL